MNAHPNTRRIVILPSFSKASRLWASLNPSILSDAFEMYTNKIIFIQQHNLLQVGAVLCRSWTEYYQIKTQKPYDNISKHEHQAFGCVGIDSSAFKAICYKAPCEKELCVWCGELIASHEWTCGKPGFGDIGRFGFNFFYCIELSYIVIKSYQSNISAYIGWDSTLQVESSPAKSENEPFLGV